MYADVGHGLWQFRRISAIDDGTSNGYGKSRL